MSEIEQLRNRVLELEELNGLNEHIDPQAFQGCHRRRMQVVAQLLLARDLVSRTAIRLAIGGDDAAERSCDVYVSKLRVQLRILGIVIHTDWGRGWFIAAADKPRLREILQPSVKKTEAA